MTDPFDQGDGFELHLGDALELLPDLPDASVDAVVTDPPYGLEFMGKEWDKLGGEGWRTGAGFSRPGIGDRPTPWASFGSGDSANATCATCGGRMRGARKCECEEPDWRVKGKPLGESPADSRAAQSQKMQAWHYAWALEALRVLKPGGHVLAFGGTRTSHRLGCALEDAGFEIRDTIRALTGEPGEPLLWLYGSGFPKSRDVSKAIDEEAGAEREVVGVKPDPRWLSPRPTGFAGDPHLTSDGSPEHPGAQVTAPATDEAERWQGWGTALKPAHEPILVARKPLVGTVAGNVLAHGTGALNIDGCRVATADALGGGAESEDWRRVESNEGWKRPWMEDPDAVAAHAARIRENVERAEALGRWPANLTLVHRADCRIVGQRAVAADGHWPAARPAGAISTEGHAGQEGLPERAARGEEVGVWECAPGCPVAELDRQTGDLHPPGNQVERPRGESGYMGAWDGENSLRPAGSYDGGGGASRFFYCAKATRSEREAGLDGLSLARRETPMAGRGQPGLKCRRCGKWKVSGSPCVCAEPDFEQVPFEAKPLNWSSGEQSPGTFQSEGTNRLVLNSHPTVKPIALMRWLVRLVTPPGGLVLDPFMGSGTTGCACALEGFRFLGVEKPDEREGDRYVRIASARIRYWGLHPRPLEEMVDEGLAEETGAPGVQLRLLG